MSPEQVAGKKVDGRSDLFSLGVALFEFATGEKPFKGGEGIGTLLFQIANDPEPDPAAINPKLPAGVKAVIHRALMKKPEERYQRGSELAADLRAALKGGQPAPAAPAPAPAAEPSKPAAAGPLPGPTKPAAWPADEPKKEEAAPKTIPITQEVELTAAAPALQEARSPERGSAPSAEGTADKPPEVSLEFTPEQIAQSLSNIPGASPEESTLVAPPSPASGQGDESVRFVESILPQAAPASIRPEDVTSPNLAEEIARFKAEQTKKEPERPA
jgi:serine/threonine protein kinase